MKNFDENISKKLNDAELPVSEGMWASIESQLPVKKERPKVWLLFLLCAFTLPFILYYASQDSGSSRTVSAEIQKQSADNEKQLLLDDARSESAHQHLDAIHLRSNQTETNQAKSTQQASTTSGNSDAIAEINESVSSVISSEAQSDDAQVATKISIEPEHSTLEKGNSTYTQTLEIENAGTTKKKLNFVRKPFKKLDIRKSKKGQLKLIEKSRITQKIEDLSPFMSITNLKKQYCEVDETVRSSTIGERMKPVGMSVAACPTFDIRPSGYYAFGEYFVGLPQQRLKSNGPEYNDLVTNRNNTESASLSSSYTLGVGKQWKSGFLVEVGVNYDKLTTNYQPAGEGQQLINIVTDQRTGEVLRIDTSYISQVMKNEFALLNIPLAIGYNIHVADSWSFTVKAGVLMNVLSSNKGIVYNGPQNSLTYSSDDLGSSLFRTNLNTSYLFSASMEREISSMLSVNLGIRANFYPSNFSLSSYGVQQRYNKYGLNVGLKHRI